MVWVKELKGTYGLNQILQWLDLSKSSWYYQQEKIPEKQQRQDLKQELIKIVTNNPAYGYRRVTSEVNDNRQKQDQSLINHKLVQKLMKDQELVARRLAARPPENPIRQMLVELKDKANLYGPLLKRAEKGEITIGIFTVFTTDFTELIYDQGPQKIQLMPIIDHVSKYCVGYALGETCTTEVAVRALADAEVNLKQLGYSLQEALIHHDQGSAYISFEWLCQVLICYLMRLSYSLHGAKNNPAHESFNGRFKKENRDLLWECATTEELLVVVKNQIDYYNLKRRHSSIGNMSPMDYIKKFGNRR